MARQPPTHTYTSQSGGGLQVECSLMPPTRMMKHTESRIILFAPIDQDHYEIMIVDHSQLDPLGKDTSLAGDVTQAGSQRGGKEVPGLDEGLAQAHIDVI